MNALMEVAMILPKPYWEDAARGLRVFHGDCRVFLSCFADGEFSAVIADVPYGVGIADWDVPPDSTVLAECLRVATGAIIWFGGAKPESVVHFAAMLPRFDRMLPWSPPQVTGAANPNGMFYSWQPVWCWRIPKTQDVLPQDRLVKKAYCVPPRRRGERPAADHPCLKPEPLLRDLVRAFGGTVEVLDPYCGTGVTGVACAGLGIPCTLIDADEECCEKTAARLSEDLSYGKRSLFNQTPMG